jgi:hypothetical protein
MTTRRDIHRRLGQLEEAIAPRGPRLCIVTVDDSGRLLRLFHDDGSPSQPAPPGLTVDDLPPSVHLLDDNADPDIICGRILPPEESSP